jgi:hypothetical protein
MDLLEARILLAEKQWPAASATLGRVVDLPTTTPEHQRTAWELLAQCHTAMGNDGAAAAAVVQAEVLHHGLTATSLAAAEQYQRNRFDLDGRRTYAATRLAESATAAAAAGRPERVAEALFDHCLTFPDEPRFRENAIAAGEALLALADACSRDAEPPGGTAARRDNRQATETLVPIAGSCFLRALDSGLDRVFATSALLAENQVQLDTVCRPLPEALLRRALAGLNRCEDLAQNHRVLGDAQRADFAAAYAKALALTCQPADHAAAAAAFGALAEASPAPWRWLCLLEVARAHLRDGDPAAATLALDGIAPPRRLLGLADSAPLDRLFAAEREFLQGFAASDALDFAQAARHFAQVAAAGGPLFAPRARFEQARALELACQWRRADTALAGLCPTTPPRGRGPSDSPSLQATAGANPSGSAGRPTGAAAMWLYSATSAAAPIHWGVQGASQVPRPPEASAPVPPCIARAAAIAMVRLADFAKTVDGLPRRRPVQPLPDDRTTRGDWFLGYGVERYVLCAQNYRFDRSGGPATGFTVRFSTSDPKEPSRLWVSAKRTDDPAALWDPVRRLRLPANRDDRGEQVPLGQGPDLLLDCAIPAGEHVLALYFVNDHHYYEPNRRYTLEVREDGALLCLADVRDFGGGVYKRFRVEGPRDLRLRIRRDASLNVLLQGVFLDPVHRPRPLPEAAAETGRCPEPRRGANRHASADPSGMPGAADLAEGRGGTADSATPPRPAEAVLAQEAVQSERPSAILPFRLRRTANAPGGGVQASAALPLPTWTPAAGRIHRGVRGASQVLRPPEAPSAASASATLWQRCETLRAGGHWREAEAAFAEFAKTVPAEAIGPLLVALAAGDQPGFDTPDGRGRLYPPGRHPLDRLWERLLADTDTLPDADLAAVVRLEQPWVTPQARLWALAALEAQADPAARPLDPELRLIASRRLLAAGWDREAAEVLRRCLNQPGRPDLRHEAALGLLKLAGRTGANAAEVQALWQTCVPVLADAPGHVRDAGVLHSASALAASGDPTAAVARLQQHSHPATWQGLARVWSDPTKALNPAGTTP